MSQRELKAAVERNKKLLEENNALLRKMHRNSIIGIWIRVAWYVLLIGLPFAVFYYVLNPYFAALGSSYETFSAGMQEIPGWKQFNAALKGDDAAN